jgi:hypothetical protein
MVASI